MDLHQKFKKLYDLFLWHLEFCEDINLLVMAFSPLKFVI